MLPEKQAEAAPIMEKLVTPVRVEIDNSIQDSKYTNKP
jgi:hypothetical protein